MLGTLDTYANLTQGFKLASKIADLDLLGLVKLSDLSIDILAPMPGVAPAPSPAAQAEAGALRQRLAASKKALARTTRALKKEKDADDKAELRSEKADLEDEIEDLEKDLARATGPDPGHFYLSGRAALLGASGGVRVSLDKTGAEFEFQAALADLGSLALEAATEGPSLTKATDFEIRLGAGNDLDGKMLAKLGAALRASAAARKAAADAVVGGTAQAIKDAEAAFEREDAKAGRDFRAANKALKKAKRKFAKAGRDLRKAKKKCKKDLGDAAFLCDTLDAARDAVKASRASLTGAKVALREIEKSASYARLQAAKATLATLRGSKSLVEAGLAGWAAVDRVGQLVVEGGNSGLVTIEEVVLDASLRAGRGSLAVTVGVGDDELEDSFELALGPGAVLDLAPLAEKVANEITAEAVKKDSPVWKALRAAKAGQR